MTLAHANDLEGDAPEREDNMKTPLIKLKAS